MSDARMLGVGPSTITPITALMSTSLRLLSWRATRAHHHWDHAQPMPSAQTEGDIGILRVKLREQPGAGRIRREELHHGSPHTACISGKILPREGSSPNGGDEHIRLRVHSA
jgi:hypothetical protein